MKAVLQASQAPAGARRDRPAASLSRRRLLGGIGAGIAALSVGGCGERSRTLFYGTDTHPADYPTVRAVVRFGELIEERSGGAMSLKLFAGGQLGSERDTLEITSFGGLDINRVNLAPLNSIEPLTIMPSLPFLFDSEAHMRRAVDGPPGARVLASLTNHDLVGLCFYDSGGRSFYNTQRPIHVPADMAGMKIRVQNSDLYVDMINALGAAATPMDLGEVYQALVQGVIDGAENNWPSYESGRHFEVAPFYSLTNHVLAPEVLVMAKASWDDLDARQREIVIESARDSVPYMRRLWDARQDKAREIVLAAGVEVNAVNPAPFRQRMLPVWNRFVVTDEQRALVASILAMGGGDA